MNAREFVECVGITAALFCMSSFASAQAAPLNHSAMPVRQALNAFIKSPNSPVPAGTQVRSVQVKNGLATVDFSGQIKDHFQNGDTQEIATVNGVLQTLGQFPSIRRAQFLVAGRQVDSLGGLLETSGPLPVIRSSAAHSAAQVAAND